MFCYTCIVQCVIEIIRHFKEKILNVIYYYVLVLLPMGGHLYNSYGFMQFNHTVDPMIFFLVAQINSFTYKPGQFVKIFLLSKCFSSMNKQSRRRRWKGMKDEPSDDRNCIRKMITAAVMSSNITKTNEESSSFTIWRRRLEIFVLCIKNAQHYCFWRSGILKDVPVGKVS